MSHTAGQTCYRCVFLFQLSRTVPSSLAQRSLSLSLRCYLPSTGHSPSETNSLRALPPWVLLWAAPSCLKTGLASKPAYGFTYQENKPTPNTTQCSSQHWGFCAATLGSDITGHSRQLASLSGMVRWPPKEHMVDFPIWSAELEEILSIVIRSWKSRIFIKCHLFLLSNKEQTSIGLEIFCATPLFMVQLTFKHVSYISCYVLTVILEWERFCDV